MNYYGVGVKFGGTQEMLPLYLEKDCWFMGFRREEKPSFYETAQKVQPGDVMIAKAYATAAQAYYYVRAIGIVTDTKKPDTIPSEMCTFGAWNPARARSLSVWRKWIEMSKQTVTLV